MVSRTDTSERLNCLGVVLAGGKSTRMGTDKAMLPFKNGTLLESQCAKLRVVFTPKNVVVSGNYPSFHYFVDQTPKLGPLGGILSAVHKFAMIEYFVFLPVDMPNIEPRTILRLLECAQMDHVNNCWSFKNFEMPLVIRNSATLVRTLKEIMSKPKAMRSIRSLCTALDYSAIDIRDTNAKEFVNANTAEEWSEVRI